MILQELYNNKYNIVICGDVNVNYLIDNNRRSQLDAVLHSYNTVGIVNNKRNRTNYKIPQNKKLIRV